MMPKRTYLVRNPIAYGGRVERGETVMLTDDEAKNFGANVALFFESSKPEAVPEKAIGEMTRPELIEKAKALGLSAGGSKADLIERIGLALGN